MKRCVGLLASALLLTTTIQAWADAKSRIATEVAEFVAGRFGRQAVREGTEALARKIETAAAKHGDEIFEAVRKVGPRALPLVEEAGAHGKQAVRVLAQHGEAGAANVVARPAAMKLGAEHGEAAAGVFVKHAGGIAEPVVEKFGAPAIRALEATGPQAGRRVAMMMADGDLAKIGRTEEVLEVIAKYGNRGAAFIWDNKGALFVGAALATFLSKPEAFINGAEKLGGAVTENVGKPLVESAVRPLAEVPGKVVDQAAGKMAEGVAQNTNWTVVILVILATGMLLLIVKLGWLRLWAVSQSSRSIPSNVAVTAAPRITNEETSAQNGRKSHV